MRILIATTHRGVIGGTEAYLCELIPALLARGHELALVYNFPASGEANAIDDGLVLPSWECRGAAPPEAFRWRPDVCLTHMTDSPDLDESLVARLPTVLFAHGYYAACATGIKCHGRRTKSPCHRTFGLTCLSLNYVMGCGTRDPRVLWDNYRKQASRIALLPRFHRVLTASRHMAGEMRRHGVPADRLTVAPLFPTRIRPSPHPPAPRPMTDRLLFVGRFTDVKGGEILIRAMKLARDRLGRPLGLVFAGCGPEESRWRTLAARLGVPAEFLGWCPADRLVELRRTSDLLAVPSLWPEPFGLVGVEAGCEGLPAVGFAVGGIPDWLIPGDTGESAPAPPSADGLADAIVRALRDPSHHHRLRVGAWEMAHRFTKGRHLDMIEDSLSGRPSEPVEAGL